MAAISACTGKQDIAGSCSTQALGDNSNICIEYYDADKGNRWQMACDAMRGQWSAASCNRASALGGCKAGNKVIWYFHSEKHPTEQDVRQSCASKDRRFIAAPGAR